MLLVDLAAIGLRDIGKTFAIRIKIYRIVG